MAIKTNTKEKADYIYTSKDSSNTRSAKRNAYHLVWYPPFPGEVAPFVIGKTRAANLWYQEGYSVKDGKKGLQVLTEGYSTNYLKTLLEYSYGREIILPLSGMPVYSQEYSVQSTNKVTQYSTIGGNTLIAFGSMPKKISMRVNIIKAGVHWVPFAAGLEAMSVLSANPSKYSGSLILYGYDTVAPSIARKYKVVIETMTPVVRSTDNIISYDINFLVAVDYHADTPSDWGKLSTGVTKNGK